MEVICLEDNAFYSLLDKLSDYIREKYTVTNDKWISGEEVMKLLRITSKTTLQKLRDEGKFKFSQPEKKMILYDRDSVLEFLEKSSRKPF
ncbi:MAG: helix-turn-helix domain-containing protein [Flavipsychrobacter sp.]|nr:helix-turn-helix domain-containing protein [Flavipsychrobacter sp.]